MPGYKDLLELMRNGKSPEEIIAQLGLYPSQLRRLLGRQRLRERLELARDISRKLAAGKLGGGIHQMVERCCEIAKDGAGDTARKAAEGLLDRAKDRLERTPSQELLVSLVRKGQLPRTVLYETTGEGW